MHIVVCMKQVPRDNSVKINPDLSINAEGIEQKSGEVARMVLPLAGRTVVAAAGGEAGFVEAAHGIRIASLKGQVHVRSRRAIVAERIDPQLVHLQVRRVVGVDRQVERTEHGAIETFAGGKIASTEVNVVDETSDVPFAHEGAP